MSIGFDYTAHLHVLLPLIACAVVGMFIGTSVLHRMNERVFQVAFRVVLTLLGVRLVVTGLIG